MGSLTPFDHACCDRSSKETQPWSCLLLCLLQQRETAAAQLGILLRPRMSPLYFVWCFWLEKAMTNNAHVVTSGKIMEFLFLMRGLLRIKMINWGEYERRIMMPRTDSPMSWRGEGIKNRLLGQANRLWWGNGLWLSVRALRSPATPDRLCRCSPTYPSVRRLLLVLNETWSGKHEAWHMGDA